MGLVRSSGRAMADVDSEASTAGPNGRLSVGGRLKTRRAFVNKVSARVRGGGVEGSDGWREGGARSRRARARAAAVEVGAEGVECCRGVERGGKGAGGVARRAKEESESEDGGGAGMIGADAERSGEAGAGAVGAAAHLRRYGTDGSGAAGSGVGRAEGGVAADEDGVGVSGRVADVLRRETDGTEKVRLPRLGRRYMTTDGRECVRGSVWKYGTG